MNRYFWVVGTDTDVGKTFITSYFMSIFQENGASVIPYKPVQTGVVFNENNSLQESDTELYKQLSAVPPRDEHISSYSFKLPASPHYAAKCEGEEIDKNIILQHITKLKETYDYVLCEGAGGLYVPLHHENGYTLLQLIKDSKLPVVLVTTTKVGTINHTLLSVEALKTNQIPLLGIIFNQSTNTPVEQDSIQMIQKLTNVPSLVIPKVESIQNIKTMKLLTNDFYTIFSTTKTEGILT